MSHLHAPGTKSRLTQAIVGGRMRIQLAYHRPRWSYRGMASLSLFPIDVEGVATRLLAGCTADGTIATCS